MKRIPKPRLTASWRRLHRSYTVILGLVLAVASAAYELLPLFRSLVAEARFAWVSMILGVLIAALRYIDQPCLRQDAPDQNQDEPS